MRKSNPIKLESGSRVGVIGGGPAGSFFSYFLLDLAQRIGIDLNVEIFEPRNFDMIGPAGCNMCGGIISESLGQNLASEGIVLPPAVVERGIDSYVLHMEEGKVRIETPLREKRIAAVHRGAGPRGMTESKWLSFDKYLLDLAIRKGAHLTRERVGDAGWADGHPKIKTKNGFQDYDLIAIAVGVNSAALKLFEKFGNGYQAPQTTKTRISDFYMGQETIGKYLGSSMHVFLLALPRLEFAALIPKGDYVTMCLLGHDIDDALVQSFLDSPQVKNCLPPDWRAPPDACHCAPRINITGAVNPFADRLVFIGDAGVTRLYKDGIGAAYRTAKAAAVTAVFQGIAAEDFRRHYLPVCKRIDFDNTIGKLLFWVTEIQRRYRHERRGILRMVVKEQQQASGPRRMSTVMWDLFTGSASYRDIFLRSLHPFFATRLVWEIMSGIFSEWRGGVAARSLGETAQPTTQSPNHPTI